MVWPGDICPKFIFYRNHTYQSPLAKYHSGPVSLKYNVSGEAVPIVTDIKIANCAWLVSCIFSIGASPTQLLIIFGARDLYEGNNGYNMVWR